MAELVRNNNGPVINCPTLCLLEPEQLPRSHEEIDEGLTDEARQALAISTCISCECSDREAYRYLSRASAVIPAPRDKGGHSRTVHPANHTGDEHDHYTRIVRVWGPKMNVLVGSALQSYRELLEERLQGGTTLTADQWMRLRSAFDAILRYLSGTERTFNSQPDERSAMRRIASGKLNPLQRWLRGHHVFTVLIQALIVTLNCFATAIKLGDLRQADEDLIVATKLMSGSGLALRFTGDFDPQDYDDVVRPTMMPPQSPPKMSGIMAMDHKHLVKTLRDLKNVFTHLDSSLHVRHQEFFNAFNEAYEAHGCVCEHFKGNERPSLLSTTSTESAVVALDRLKQGRLDLLKPLHGETLESQLSFSTNQPRVRERA